MLKCRACSWYLYHSLPLDPDEIIDHRKVATSEVSPHSLRMSNEPFTHVYQTQNSDSSHILLDNVIVIICLQVECYCLKLVFIESLINAWLPCLAHLVWAFRLPQIKPVAMLHQIQVQRGSYIGRSVYHNWPCHSGTQHCYMGSFNSTPPGQNGRKITDDKF